VIPSQTSDLTAVHAVLPVRGLSDGKERLGSALDAEEREALILGMLLTTLGALRGCPAVLAVHVVTRDATLRRLVAREGAVAVAEEEGDGLNGAVRAGRRSAVAAGASAVLCLPVDLPLLTPASLNVLLDAADAALAAGRGRKAVVVAPSDVGGGTNALLLCPPDVIEPAFGVDSLAAHVRAAAAADASLQLVVESTLGFDLDTPEDLERLDAARLVELLGRGAEALALSDTI